MSRLTRRQQADALVQRHYFDRGWLHAYRRFEQMLRQGVAAGDRVADIGCGRNFPLAGLLRDCGTVAVGIDPQADPAAAPPGAAVRRGSADAIPAEAGEFDTIVCRCVLEHLPRPADALAEFARVLAPGGRVLFLTPNLYDYVSVLAAVIPNALHGPIVRWSEGRDESDTFPTYYRANTKRRIRRLASAAGLEVRRLEYANNYPSSLMFSPLLCRAGIAYDHLVTSVKSLNWLQAWLMGEMVKTSTE